MLSLPDGLVSDVTAFIVRSSDTEDSEAYVRFPEEPMDAQRLTLTFERFGLPTRRVKTYFPPPCDRQHPKPTLDKRSDVAAVTIGTRACPSPAAVNWTSSSQLASVRLKRCTASGTQTARIAAHHRAMAISGWSSCQEPEEG